MKNTSFQDEMVQSDRIIYTPSAFAKNALIHLQETGTLHALKKHTSKRSRLASYLFFCVKKGDGTLIYDGNTYALNTGDCVFLNCQKHYSHSTSQNLWTLQWAHFYGPNLDAIYEQYTDSNDGPVFHPDHLHPYEEFLTAIHEIAAGEIPARDMLICEKLTGLLALTLHDCERNETTGISAPKADLLKNVKNYLDEHFREKISLDFLAGYFFIDKYYLTRRFKQQYGCTVNTYIQQCKITHAKHLLRFSDRSIEEIGLACGLEDANYFARLFRKIEGVSPGEFRRSWRGGT